MTRAGRKPPVEPLPPRKRWISNFTWFSLALLLVAGGLGWLFGQGGQLLVPWLVDASFEGAYFDDSQPRGKLVILTVVETRATDGISNVRSHGTAHLIDVATGGRVARIAWHPRWRAIGVTPNLFWAYDEEHQ